MPVDDVHIDVSVAIDVLKSKTEVLVRVLDKASLFLQFIHKVSQC